MTELTNEQIHDALVLPYLNHAMRMFESGYATAADIDAAMRFGCGYPVGPLAAVEARGLAEVRDALTALHAETGDPLHAPAGVLEKLLADGETFTSGVGSDTGAANGDASRIGLVGVVGTGTMASGIAQVFAQSGLDVVVVGRSQEKADGAVAGIASGLDRLLAKGRIDADARDATLARLRPVADRAALADVDLVVEAIAEDLDIKTALFADLDRICKPGAILATTTSSLPITRLGETTSRPESVIGMHFFNPAAVMKLVEVVTTQATSPEVDATVLALCDVVGKVAVSCGDRAGFIVNCLLFPYLNDAARLVDSGAATIEQVDAAIVEQAGFPMGPFALLDVVGTDVSLAIQKELHREFDEPGFTPAASLEAAVAEGRLGRKTGEGFLTY